jgi:hypothetical protein
VLLSEIDNLESLNLLILGISKAWSHWISSHEHRVGCRQAAYYLVFTSMMRRGRKLHVFSINSGAVAIKYDMVARNLNGHIIIFSEHWSLDWTVVSSENTINKIGKVLDRISFFSLKKIIFYLLVFILVK